MFHIQAINLLKHIEEENKHSNVCADSKIVRYKRVMECTVWVSDRVRMRESERRQCYKDRRLFKSVVIRSAREKFRMVPVVPIDQWPRQNRNYLATSENRVNRRGVRHFYILLAFLLHYLNYLETVPNLKPHTRPCSVPSWNFSVIFLQEK